MWGVCLIFLLGSYLICLCSFEVFWVLYPSNLGLIDYLPLSCSLGLVHLYFYLFWVFWCSIDLYLRFFGVNSVCFTRRVYLTPLYYTIYVNLLNKLKEGFALLKFIFS